MSMSKKTGTKEWADATVNCTTGCVHDCHYCYAKAMAIRFRRATPATWSNMVPRPWDKIIASIPKRSATTIMFPSAHDITPKNLELCCKTLREILYYGHRVVLVTKPHIECVKQICNEFKNRKDQILWRFTIGARVTEILQFWEPAAPSFYERMHCLEHAFMNGWQTSVSMEPVLCTHEYWADMNVCTVDPLVTQDIWVGFGRNMAARCRRNGAPQEVIVEAERMGRTQNVTLAERLQHEIGANKKVRYKDSIRELLEKGEP
jgi:DNA repair photolyase